MVAIYSGLPALAAAVLAIVLDVRAYGWGLDTGVRGPTWRWELQSGTGRLVAPLAGEGKGAALNACNRGASGKHAAWSYGLYGRRAGGGDVLIGPDGALVEGSREHVEVLAEVAHLAGGCVRRY
jgi:hypothetical protein